MNQPSRNTLWEQTVAAARRSGAVPAAAPVADIVPPPGFAARLAARWAELKQNETFRLWCRWSYRSALAGLLIAGIIALVSPPPAKPVPPLRVPGVEVPTFSAP